MSLVLTAEDRVTLAAALARAKRVWQWRHYQTMLLVGDGTSAEQAAHAVGASRAGVYNWVASWQQGGVTARRYAVFRDRRVTARLQSGRGRK